MFLVKGSLQCRSIELACMHCACIAELPWLKRGTSTRKCCIASACCKRLCAHDLIHPLSCLTRFQHTQPISRLTPPPPQAIQSNGRLEALSVYNNAIGSEGCRALTAAVAACRHLRVVEFLPGNCAATQDIKLLAQAVKRNRRWVPWCQKNAGFGAPNVHELGSLACR
jgi:hypothetical protein